MSRRLNPSSRDVLLMDTLVTVMCIIFGIWLGIQSARDQKERDRGKVCPTCKGTGKFRSGQWGGFWDTCERCGGKGIL